jgi:hypothetical protein
MTALSGYAGNTIHTVWDIDGTIAVDLNEVYLPEQKQAYLADSRNLVTVKFPTGDVITYYIFPGVRESMTHLLRNGEKVSFFSQGTELRNTWLLRSILLADGRSLEQIATHILSKQHQGVGDEDTAQRKGMMVLREEVREEGAPPRKDLALVEKDISNTVLFDDSRFGIIPSQQDNWIKIDIFRPDRILLAMGIFEEAKELSKANSLSIQEALAVTKSEYLKLSNEQHVERARAKLPSELSCLIQLNAL